MVDYTRAISGPKPYCNQADRLGVEWGQAIRKQFDEQDTLAADSATRRKERGARRLLHKQLAQERLAVYIAHQEAAHEEAAHEKAAHQEAAHQEVAHREAPH